MNGQIVNARVCKRTHLQIANRLHGKAAERAVLTEITVLKLRGPSSTFTVSRSQRN